MSLPHITPSQGVFWFVTIVLVEAAVIDGWKLKVPNWLTLHFVAGGLGYAAYTAGFGGFLWALAGALVGLALLLPWYAIGGMGAGDVKLLAGVGAWIGMSLTLWAFLVSAILGAVMAVAMAARSGNLLKHWVQFHEIRHEILTIRNPAKLAAIAAERKPRMMLLPYGIPIAIGTIGFFAWMRFLF
jgi:prepilin peptidase CpaA